MGSAELRFLFQIRGKLLFLSSLDRCTRGVLSNQSTVCRQVQDINLSIYDFLCSMFLEFLYFIYYYWKRSLESNARFKCARSHCSQSEDARAGLDAGLPCAPTKNTSLLRALQRRTWSSANFTETSFSSPSSAVWHCRLGIGRDLTVTRYKEPRSGSAFAPSTRAYSFWLYGKWQYIFYLRK